jgi:type III secretion inner rod protein HrpB2
MTVASIAFEVHPMLSQTAETVSGQPSQVEVQKFQELMNAPTMVTPDNTQNPPQEGWKDVSKVIETQDARYQDVINQISNFSTQTDPSNPTETLRRSGQLSVEIAEMNFDQQTKMALVSSSKSSIETLMKNQ